MPIAVGVSPCVLPWPVFLPATGVLATKVEGDQGCPQAQSWPMHMVVPMLCDSPLSTHGCTRQGTGHCHARVLGGDSGTEW